VPLELTFTRRAVKDLRALPAADRRRILERLERHALEPDGAGQDVVRLAGTPDGYRLRAGDWRALFCVRGSVMEVQRVLHRREAYR
jgi:mRNA interferase RelE/StbE